MTNDKFKIHFPVLQKEVLEIFDPQPNQNFIDCTIGGGGHALAILEKTAPKGKILGIDWDQEMIKSLKSKVESLKLSRRLILVNDSFVNLKKIVEKENFKDVDGILLDLGLSSWHLEKSGRGFTFMVLVWANVTAQPPSARTARTANVVVCVIGPVGSAIVLPVPGTGCPMSTLPGSARS